MGYCFGQWYELWVIDWVEYYVGVGIVGDVCYFGCQVLFLGGDDMGGIGIE